MDICASPKVPEKTKINNKKLFGHIYCDIPIFVETKSEYGYISRHLIFLRTYEP
jgi:hypothetical protein